MKIEFEYRGINKVEYKTKYSAGADVISQITTIIQRFETKVIPLGLFVVDFDFDHGDNWLPFIKLCPRSSLSRKGIICHDGTIDVDFHSREIHAILTNCGEDAFFVNAGDRIAQIICLSCIRSHSFAIRNVAREGGFGSTGN